MKKIFIIAFGICGLQINAQVLPPINCSDAITICDSVEIQDTLKVAISFSSNEISNNSCLPFGEIRGTWYKFGINDIGNLRFTITPFDTLVDFDWALYHINWSNCTDIFGVPSLEVSCNAAGIGGGDYTTGASGLVQQGHNPAINVTIPSVFYLYVTTSMQDTASVLGYTIDFSASDFDFVPCTEIGIEEELGSIVNVYPNPVNDVLQVQLAATTQSSSINVYDMSGRNVLVYNSVGSISMLDVSSLPPGVYILEVHTDKGISRKKVIKN